MPRFTPLLALTLGTAPLMPIPAAAPALVDLRSHARLVLVFAPTAADPRLAAQRAEWRRLGPGAAERDLRLIEVVGATVTGALDSAPALRARYGIAPAAFAALLIGKDGHAALREGEPLTAARLTGAIDAMPMRRDEMRRR